MGTKCVGNKRTWFSSGMEKRDLLTNDVIAVANEKQLPLEAVSIVLKVKIIKIK